MCRELTCNSRSELLGADPLSTTTTSAKEMAAEPEPIEENHHSLSEVEVGHGQRRPTGVHSPELRAVEISHTHRVCVVLVGCVQARRVCRRSRGCASERLLFFHFAVQDQSTHTGVYV
ncbi:hypothetical protein R6Q59_035836 [Mikania micrantha]